MQKVGMSSTRTEAEENLDQYFVFSEVKSKIFSSFICMHILSDILLEVLRFSAMWNTCMFVFPL